MNQQSSKNIIWNSTKAIHFHIRYFFKEVENKYLQQNQSNHYLILDQNICSVWNKKNIRKVSRTIPIDIKLILWRKPKYYYTTHNEPFSWTKTFYSSTFYSLKIWHDDGKCRVIMDAPSIHTGVVKVISSSALLRLLSFDAKGWWSPRFLDRFYVWIVKFPFYLLSACLPRFCLAIRAWVADNVGSYLDAVGNW